MIKDIYGILFPFYWLIYKINTSDKEIFQKKHFEVVKLILNRHAIYGFEEERICKILWNNLWDSSEYSSCGLGSSIHFQKIMSLL